MSNQKIGGVLGDGTRRFNPCKGIVAQNVVSHLGLWVAGAHIAIFGYLKKMRQNETLLK